MDIRTEQLEALLKQQEFQTKKASAAKNSAAEGFEATLQKQVSLGDVDDDSLIAPTPPGVQASLVGQVLLAGAENIAASQGGSISEQKAYDVAAGAINKWESYVDTLKSPREGDLRDAYSALEDVTSHVQTLKQQSEPLLEQNSNLASLVNELEILATTEKFKFNRGDYLT